jgi:hypothetical protein
VDKVQLVPYEEDLRVEYLLGQTWTETMTIPAHLASSLIEQYKKMAGLPLGYRMAMKGLMFIRYNENGSVIPIIEAAFTEYPTQTSRALLQPGERDYELHLLLTPARWGERTTIRIKEVS